MITTNADYSLEEILPRLAAYTTGNVVEKVTCENKYEIKGAKDLAENGPISGSAVFNKESFLAGARGEKHPPEKKPSLVKQLNGAGKKVALLDLGAKDNIARSLAMRGCDVTIYPALTPAADIIADKPDGIMLSNGPGDPKE